ncbi:endolytic transglycosylase MltG [Evansella sp. AB-rgal1]|uniref:endolytic transglycosylase MltG n=1 Tax=Evansella sp. AB-rgal1 TaxID=3242696 RepID=UPI00359EB963
MRLSDKNNKNKKKQQHIEKMYERQKEAKIVRRIVFVFILLLLITVVGAGYSGYTYFMNSIGPMDENDEELIEVTIPIGSSATGIGNILEENDLIKSSRFFRLYVRFQNETGFQAGDYILSRSMDMDDMIEELKSGVVRQDYQLTFTIPEGRWLDDVVKRIADNTNLTEEDLMEKLEDEEYLDELIERFAIVDEVILDDRIRWPLEGYLFPQRYDFLEEEIEVEELIEAMLARTTKALIDSEAGSSDYSYHDILTMASIIEGEARNDEERQMISGVIHNRLHPNVRMQLQMDPTVAYAHGEHLPRTLNEHLKIESPYNTYYVSGLPIGPINNPGEASIWAALHPEPHNYLYFFHSPDGQVHFSETLGEHNAIVQQYR